MHRENAAEKPWTCFSPHSTLCLVFIATAHIKGMLLDVFSQSWFLYWLACRIQKVGRPQEHTPLGNLGAMTFNFVYLYNNNTLFVNKLWLNSGSIYNAVSYSERNFNISPFFLWLTKELRFHAKLKNCQDGKKSVFYTFWSNTIDRGQLASCVSTLSFNSTGTFLLRLDKGEDRQAELLLFCECYSCIFFLWTVISL